MKIAAAYIRVSTDDQIEYSPDSQLRAIQNYAEKNITANNIRIRVGMAIKLFFEVLRLVAVALSILVAIYILVLAIFGFLLLLC